MNSTHGNKIANLDNLKDDRIRISLTDVANVLKKLPTKRCSGPDGIPMCIYKHGADYLVPILTRLLI